MATIIIMVLAPADADVQDLPTGSGIRSCGLTDQRTRLQTRPPGAPIPMRALFAGMTSTLWTIAAAAACTLFLPTVSFAYDFRPTPSEWAMWPDFCKARYVTTTAGNTSPYAATVPPAMIENWRARLGDATFDAVHHYCAGVAYTQRAAVARSAQQRTYLLNVAESECKYSFERTPVSSPLYREIARNLQLVRAMRGVTPPVPH